MNDTRTQQLIDWAQVIGEFVLREREEGILYWKGKLDTAVKNKDINGVDYAHNKLTYFINSEWERVLNTGDGEVMTRTRFAHLGFNIR